MMKNLLMGIMLLLVSGAASAEWTDVGDNENITQYVDRATIRRIGNLVKMWSLRDYKKAEVIKGESNLSSRIQQEYDCKEETLRFLAITVFSGKMGSGTVNYTNADTEQWVPVSPGSVTEVLWKIACGKE